MPWVVVMAMILASVGLWADRQAVRAPLRLLCPICRDEVEAQGHCCPRCATNLVTRELALEVVLAVRDRDDRRARYAGWSQHLIVSAVLLLLMALLVDRYFWA